MITSVSCQEAKVQGEDLIDKSIDKTKEVTKESLKEGIDKTFGVLTSTKRSSFQSVFKTADSLNVKDIEGLWIDFPVSFYYCFLKYEADRETVLEYIASQPTRLPEISDQTWHTIDSGEMFSNLRFIEEKAPGIMAQLDFFMELKEKDGLEYFRCNRYPNAHYVAVDSNAGIIYHHFESYWD